MDDHRHWAARAAAWGVDYRESLRRRPVRPPVAPGDIAARLPAAPPEQPEPFAEVFADFERIIVPGMTHWQHPRFFAYFPANAAPASVVAEHLANAMAAVCMLWQTSPAATELETRMIDWLRQALGLPEGFAGVLQDTASTATLAAVLVMRERALGWQGKVQGLAAAPRLRVYTSAEAHSSVLRAIWFAGIGEQNLVRLPGVGSRRGVDPMALRRAIEEDRRDGLRPAGIVASIGATGMGACDPLTEVAVIARQYDLYLHVDAAWAGSAMICPELRGLWEGVEAADSIVVNPHKWLGAQSPCTAHFVRDPAVLVRTLAARPDYLRTLDHEDVVDYSEWGIPLGRQFRALKVWFLLRAYGLAGLRQRIRNHITWSQGLCERLRGTAGFRIVSEPILSLFTFRYAPAGVDDLDALNLRLVEAIHADGRTYLTQTRIDGSVVLRFQVGPFDCTEEDVQTAGDAIVEVARRLPRPGPGSRRQEPAPG